MDIQGAWCGALLKFDIMGLILIISVCGRSSDMDEAAEWFRGVWWGVLPDFDIISQIVIIAISVRSGVMGKAAGWLRKAFAVLPLRSLISQVTFRSSFFCVRSGDMRCLETQSTILHQSRRATGPPSLNNLGQHCVKQILFLN